jgi:hypothetical protein
VSVPRLGHRELCLLATMASPFSLLVVGDRIAERLAGKGYLATRSPKSGDGLLAVTPAALRRLADEMEAGNIEQFFDERYRRDRVRLYVDGRK